MPAFVVYDYRGVFNTPYVRVDVEGHLSVLLRRTDRGWMTLTDSGVVYAATQKQAVELALGIELPNWRG